MKIYVTGAIRIHGITEAEAEFNKMFDRLKEIGYTDICSPLEIVKSDLTSKLEEQKRYEMIDSCDLILFRRDWNIDSMSLKEFVYREKYRPGIKMTYDSFEDWVYLRNMIGFYCN
jgi:hypothetical protein